MAKLPTPPKLKVPKPGVNKNPANYLRGSKTIGQKYTAYDNYNQGKPDFGKGAGPGTPYHEVQKTVQKAIPGAGKPVNAGPPTNSHIHLPNWFGRSPSIGNGGYLDNIVRNARSAAIRKRLEGGSKVAY